MKNSLNHRTEALRASLRNEGLDGYLVTNENNIYYFTGFFFWEVGVREGGRLLIPRQGENRLYVQEKNYEAARQTAKNCTVELVKRKEKVDLKIASDARNLKLKRLGFNSLDASAYLKLFRTLTGTRLKALGKLVWELRRVKDKTELKHMRKAAELTSIGMKTALETVRPGLQEYEVAAEMEYAMRRLGSDGVAFDTMVASGVRSAFPHGGCTDRKIRKGDLVVIDVGAKYRHYRADLTRTVAVGKPSPKQRKIHEVVKEAQERAFQTIKAGVKACDIDAVARILIEKEGYGKHFVHGLGHGVGLDIHEPPSLNPENEEALKAGNVVTVEPGIYIVDFGGIRIEDTVLVREDGAERLTEAPYALEVG